MGLNFNTGGSFSIVLGLEDIGSLGREMLKRAISRTVFCFLRVLFTFLDFQESSTVFASPDSSPE